MWHDGWMGGMHWFWWVFWVIFVIVLVWAVTRSSSPPPPHQETPLEILKRRYAEGEISTEEFERRKSRLEEK